MKRVLIGLIPVIVLGGFLYALATSGPAPPEEESQVGKLNVTVATDLSNRIDPDSLPNQAVRDKAAVNAVLDVFHQTVRQKLFIASNDRLAVELIPQKGNPRAFGYLDRLTIDMASTPVDERRQALDSLTADFRAYLDTLYAEATEIERYWGADVHRYFEELRLDTEGSSQESTRHVLVVLTDGYVIAEDNMYREGCRSNYLNADLLNQFREQPGWKEEFEARDCGLIPARRDLGNLEVLVIGLRPRSHFNEGAILRRYWRKWMREMNVQRFAIHPSCTSPDDCRQLVRGFMNGQS